MRGAASCGSLTSVILGLAADPLILVAQGASRDLNPSLPQSVVDRALELDEAVARAEYLAQFRSDLEAFVSREAVEACVSVGCFERAPLSDVEYRAFCDPSGGSADSMTMAIGQQGRRHGGHRRAAREAASILA
jgi:hypothetical protein